MNATLIDAIRALEQNAPQAFHDALTIDAPLVRRSRLQAWFGDDAAAVSAWAELQGDAGRKWPHLVHPFVTRRALQQGTRCDVARWRIEAIERRLKEEGVSSAAGDDTAFDATSGAGGEWTTWTTGDPRSTILALEPDADLAACARANAGRLATPNARVAAARVEQATLTEALAAGLPPIRFALVDPDRRDGQRRSASMLADARPGPESLIALAHRIDERMVVKAAPALSDAGPLADLQPEWTWISSHGDVCEASLWFGPLRRAERRCVALPSGDELLRSDHEPLPPPRRCPREGDRLVVPSRVVRAAAMTSDLAAALDAEAMTDGPGAALLEPRTSRGWHVGAGGLFRSFHVREVLPKGRSPLRKALRALPAITWKRLPSPPLPEEILKELERASHARSSEPRTILLQCAVEGRARLVRLKPDADFEAPDADETGGYSAPPAPPLR